MDREKIEFANSLESVAEKIFNGREFTEEILMRHPHLQTYLPLMRLTIRENYYRRDQSSFPYAVMEKIEEKVRKDTQHSVEAVTWTVAGAILIKDECLEGLPEHQVRFMLDLALETGLIDRIERQEGVERNLAYGIIDSKHRDEALETLTDWKDGVKYYRRLQEKLREKATPRPLPVEHKYLL